MVQSKYGSTVWQRAFRICIQRELSGTLKGNFSLCYWFFVSPEVKNIPQSSLFLSAHLGTLEYFEMLSLFKFSCTCSSVSLPCPMRKFSWFPSFSSSHIISSSHLLGPSWLTVTLIYWLQSSWAWTFMSRRNIMRPHLSTQLLIWKD